MEKQTVFIKRYPSKGEFPNKDKTWVIANGTGLNYYNGVFKCPHTGEVQKDIHWWLEEIELPSEEEIIEVAPNVRCVNQFWDGVNFILNKIKWR